MSTRERICRLARFGLTTADVSRLTDFYESAFGFHRIGAERRNGPEFESLMGVRGGADVTTLRLGQEVVELLQFDQPGQPYPARSSASDLVFQHFAIVVTDIGSAWQRLCAVNGWSAITRDTPQALPKSSGGVSAFKFRDPDGHPLELLQFPTSNTPPKWRGFNASATYLGIDHSALSITDTAISSAFYKSFGFRVSGHSHNQGPEQDALDDISEAQVEVVALAAAELTPHIELLCYRPEGLDRPLLYKANDVAATRLILELCRFGHDDGDPATRSLLDPDAHHLIIVSDPNLKRPR